MKKHINKVLAKLEQWLFYRYFFGISLVAWVIAFALLALVMLTARLTKVH